MSRVSNKQASLVEFWELQGLQWESPRNYKISIAGWDGYATNIVYGTFNLVECWRDTQLETGPTLVHFLPILVFEQSWSMQAAADLMSWREVAHHPCPGITSRIK